MAKAIHEQDLEHGWKFVQMLNVLGGSVNKCGKIKKGSGVFSRMFSLSISALRHLSSDSALWEFLSPYTVKLCIRILCPSFGF